MCSMCFLRSFEPTSLRMTADQGVPFCESRFPVLSASWVRPGLLCVGPLAYTRKAFPGDGLGVGPGRPGRTEPSATIGP